MHCEGFIYDDSLHYLDHLAPFCSLMGWKLSFSNSCLLEKALYFYPELAAAEKNIWDPFPLPILSCEPRRLIRAACNNPHLKTIWLPHGNSDKGWKAPFFEALETGEPALVYGQKMIDFFHKKKVMAHPIPIGNFRKFYFEKHFEFYENRLQELKIPKNRVNFLYAPTWEDAEQSCSFWNAFPKLAESVPDDVNLLVKWHPNTYRIHADKIEMLIGRWQNKQNIVFIEDFPPIYPLLSISDAYIGDMSSIGYDFLSFNRPMFFFNTQNRNSRSDKGLYLFQCGIEIPLNQVDSIFSHFEEIKEKKNETRKKIYDYTFSPSFNPKTIVERCAQLL